jgi:hypothetical protein
MACNTAKVSKITSGKNYNLGDSVNGTSSNYKGVVSEMAELIFMNELPFMICIFSKYQSWMVISINITPQIQSDGDQFITSVFMMALNYPYSRRCQQ